MLPRITAVRVGLVLACVAPALGAAGGQHNEPDFALQGEYLGNLTSGRLVLCHFAYEG